MNAPLFWGATLLGSCMLAACYGVGAGTSTNGGSGGTGGYAGAGGYGGTAGYGGSGGSAGSPSPPPGTPTGLPCDVQSILAAHCTGCHSDPPASGPMGLVTYADLTAPAVTDPTKTVAEMCVLRVQDTTRPMPPAPGSPLAAADVATLQSWVSAGTPMGTCGVVDSGTGAGGGGNPYGTPVTCTSGSYWHGGEDGPNMDPGAACISCHSRSAEAPRFAIAGTVYPTAHEPIDCNGQGGVSVVITDALGQSFSIASNGAGNFFAGGAISLPFTAKVVANGRERVMTAAQTNGDCNSCHAEPPANGAPGRIMAP